MVKERTTREKLVFAATDHFRRKGYAAAGLAEILEAAGVPKGSLYHHFPGGKPDLALATAEWAGRYLSRMMDEAFEESASFGEGVRRIAGAIADIHDARGAWDFCPVTGTLLGGPADERFRLAAREIFEGWVALGVRHAVRFGLSRERAEVKARAALLLLEGAWITARADGSADVIRQIPEMLDLA